VFFEEDFFFEKLEKITFSEKNRKIYARFTTRNAMVAGRPQSLYSSLSVYCKSAGFFDFFSEKLEKVHSLYSSLVD
jgi:hypothetical protein